MISKCVSGKRIFQSEHLAEDALIELWIQNEYVPGRAPIAIYKCEDCGLFHLTSTGEMNPKLHDFIKSPEYKLKKEGQKWLDKFRNKR